MVSLMDASRDRNGHLHGSEVNKRKQTYIENDIIMWYRNVLPYL